MTIPDRPSSPRPGGVPYFIQNQCDDCGGPLALRAENEGWLDEFECPQCQLGVYLDVPPFKNYHLFGKDAPYREEMEE